MGKKIIIADRECLPSHNRTSPVRLEMAERAELEIINERDPQPTARELRAERRKVKSDARKNRDTTRQQRAMAKRSVSSTDFAPGDLVTQRKSPHVVGLVMDTTLQYGGDQILEVMCGADTTWWRAKGCILVE